MSTMQFTPAARQRTTMELSRDYHRHSLSMSFEAHLAIHYSALLISRGCHLKVPHAAIVRRAVCRYATFLGGLSPDQLKDEAGMVSRASKTSNGTQGQQQEALQRLDNIAAPQTPFKEVLEGKDFSPPLDLAALDARVDELIGAGRTRARKAKDGTQ